jgi:hypothetical protein
LLILRTTTKSTPQTQSNSSFTKAPYAQYNFSTYSYSIDGHPAKATEGNTVLANLAAGSHTLTIYANATYQSGSNNSNSNTINDMMLAKVYFSAVYPTAWVTFALILIASISVDSLVLFTNRRKLARRFKTEKTDIFWIGLPCFFLASVIFIGSVWVMASGYLFPYYYDRFGFNWVSPILGSIVGLIFVGLGAGMMSLGTRERKGAVEKRVNATPQKS